MDRKHGRIIVWMRRALRVQDNAPLWNAMQDGREVIPLVCLSDDPAYLAETPRRVFFRNALRALDHELRERSSKLTVRVGTAAREIPAAAYEYGADAVYAARVYDPAALHRDTTLSTSLMKIGVEWETFQDSLLFERTDIVSGTGMPYRVYTPYLRSWRDRWDDAPRPIPRVRTVASPDIRGSEPGAFRWFAAADASGGERAAQRRLTTFLKNSIHAYRGNRDLPGVDGTSRLSADLAHGTLSIRTLYWAAREAREEADRKGRESIESFINELVWREFYYQIFSNFPFAADGAFREEFRTINWRENRGHFDAWCAGRTGYPIVDAAMRQLHREGWMHNRARMIVASFLTKDLHISWQRGERYFLEHLVDADIASNNGGWQWTAGTGTDASPYFRIFNPVLQGKKFDPEGTYIRRYVPELARVPQRMIHEPWRLDLDGQRSAGCLIGKQYPAPMVDHTAEREVALRLYRSPLSTRVRDPKSGGR